MIKLEPDLLIGKGSERFCYRHPLYPDRCIKVPHHLEERNQHQNEKDFDYYQQLAKRNIDWQHIPRCYGWVDTDQGRGLMFELMQDEQQRPLSSVMDLLVDDAIALNPLEQAFDSLHQYMVRNMIFTSDMGLTNIVCRQREDGDYHLYIIDGLGDRDFIKIAAHSRYFGLRKVHRQWQRFYAKFERRYQAIRKNLVRT